MYPAQHLKYTYFTERITRGQDLAQGLWLSVFFHYYYYCFYFITVFAVADGFLSARSVSSSSVLQNIQSPEWCWLMIEARCEIKRHPDDNWLFWWVAWWREEWWVGGRRERCCRSKNTKRRSKVNTSHCSRYSDRNKRRTLRGNVVFECELWGWEEY